VEGGAAQAVADERDVFLLRTGGSHRLQATCVARARSDMASRVPACEPPGSR
jgi:hypothetical protein